jgi:flagellar motor switch/type III secretory pathway protein FliN
MAFSINMDKAKEIHLTKIRQVRRDMFPKLDIDFMKALENGNTELSSEIGTTKQQLRDITGMDLENVSDLDSLRNMWPIELLGDSPYEK